MFFQRTANAKNEPEGSEHCKNSFASQKTAERFELYIDRVEIANGCTENLKPSIPVPWGPLPPCAGCGLGLDRLWMVLNHQKSI